MIYSTCTRYNAFQNEELRPNFERIEETCVKAVFALSRFAINRAADQHKALEP